MSDESDDYATLTALQQKYKMPGLKMETPDGRRQKRRLEESEQYFKGYSAHWEEDRDLLVNFQKMVSAFGTYVAIAYPIIGNYINDVYYRNPDPFIQDKGGDRDLSRILTDVIGSTHAQCDTETEIKHCLLDQGWASFGVIAGSFLQKPHNAGELVMEEPDEPAPDGDEAAAQGAPAMRPATMLQHTGEFDPFGQAVMQRVPSGETVEPTEQRVILQRISPWMCRFDPRGRRWDMSDHAWWGYQDSPYLADLLRDSRLSFEDKCFLMMFYGTHAAAFTVDGGGENATATGYRELDPELIRVKCDNVWNRRDHMIYRMPAGASRTFTPQPWDPEWEHADAFPIRYMPVNKVPEDEKNTEGFIGLSWMRLIGEHVKNINKLQGLIVNALGKVVDVYSVWKGSIPSFTLGKISDAGREFNVIQIDPEPYQKYSAQPDAPLKLQDVMHLLDVGDTKDMQHMQKIDHEFGLIAQIFGQGPADRGGVSASDTATESLGVQQGLSRRLASARNEAGKHYNAVSKMIFLILQARQTLPIKYQMTTQFNAKVWATFTDPQTTLKDLDLHFQYATGSTEPQTREQQFALRERAATILMPIFRANQDNRNVMALARLLTEPLNIIGIDAFFNDAASEILMQIEMIILALGKGKVLADNEQASVQVVELISKLVNEMLTPAQLQQVVARVQDVDAPDQGPQNVGSLPAAPSPGEASAAAGAAGSAAAGAQGGIQYSEALPTPSLADPAS